MPERRRSSVAEVLDSVSWDYDPESEQPSPLVSTARYFRDFPWEPEDLFPRRRTAAGQAQAEPGPSRRRAR